MKKRFLLLILIISLFLPSVSFAAKDVDITLKESTSIVKGETVGFDLDVKFNTPISKMNSLFITIKLDDKLNYVNGEVVDASEIPGVFEISSRANNSGRFGFVNIKLTDMKALDKNSFKVRFNANLDDNAKVGSTLENRVIVSSQTQAQNAKNKASSTSYENTVKTNKVLKVAPKENKKEEKPIEKPVEKPVEKPIEKPSDKTVDFINDAPSENSNNDNLLLKTGGYYSNFMTELDGKTNPQNKLIASLDGQTFDVKVRPSGTFKINIPPKYEDIIEIEVYRDKKLIEKKTINYVDEDSMRKEMLDDIIEGFKSFGYENVVKANLSEFEKQTNFIDFFLGKDVGLYQNMFELFRKIYEDTRDTSSDVKMHEPYMKGLPNGKFKPQGTVTRAEVATILARIMTDGNVPKGKPKAKDARSDWYSDYIAFVEKEGIMKGFDDGSFKPNAKISRAEVAAIISRYKSLNNSASASFPDVKSSHWAYKDIARVNEMGYMLGFPDGTFGPSSNVTRAEIVTTINRVLDRHPDESYIDVKRPKPFKDIDDNWAYYQIIEATVKHDYVVIDGVEIYK